MKFVKPSSAVVASFTHSDFKIVNVGIPSAF